MLLAPSLTGVIVATLLTAAAVGILALKSSLSTAPFNVVAANSASNAPTALFSTLSCAV